MELRDNDADVKYPPSATSTRSEDSMSRWIEPTFLEGRHVTLEPLQLSHYEDLQKAASDGELWNLWYTSVPALDKTRTYIQAALDSQVQFGTLAFAVREKSKDTVVGTTRYCNVDSNNRRLEIGYTWYAQSAQKTAVNTECKLLLLTHAFERLNSIAVEFRTHWLNQQSRNAIARLGAKQDGVLRNHQRMPDGSYRDTVVFSIIESEWPAIKRNLLFKLKPEFGSEKQ